MPLDPVDLPPLPNRDELPQRIRAAEANAQKLRIRAAEKIKAAHQAAEKARRALYAYAAVARGNRTALAVSTVQSACDELATAAGAYTLGATYPCAEVTESYLQRKAPKLHPQGATTGPNDEDEAAPSQPPPDLSDPILSALTAGNPVQATNPATRILVRVIRGQAAAQAASALAASGKPVPPELVELIESTVADLTSVLRPPPSPAVQISATGGTTAGAIDAEFEDVP